jgi:hypothetical protein
MYKGSEVEAQVGDIVEPYDRFFKGTVTEVISAHFVRVSWNRWLTEDYIETEMPAQIYFVRRAQPTDSGMRDGERKDVSAKR